MKNVSYYRVTALLEQYFRLTYKTVDRMADIIFWPLLSILTWGFITKFLQTGYEVNIIVLIMAGFIFYQFYQRCQTDIPLYLLEDFWTDNLQNIFSTPITQWDKLVALTIFAVFKAMLTALIAYIAAYFLFAFNLLTLSPFYLTLWLFALMLFSIALGIFLSGVLFRYGTNAQMVAWGFAFFLQPVMAVFYPVSVLPLTLQYITKLIPATYVFEGLRELISAGTFNYSNFFVSVTLSLILIVVACALYNLAFQYNKRMGKLVHVD